MIVFYVAIIFMIIFGVYRREVCCLDAALEFNQVNVVKGIFILLVFLSHIKTYILQSGCVFNKLDELTIAFFDIGQNVVIMFLFYSGYGIHQQICKHGDKYVNNIPRHRILNTLMNFDVAVLFFIALAVFSGVPITLGKTLLSLLGWESLGNSNWYIFDILVLYAIVWITHICIRKTLLQWLVFSILAIAFTIVMFLTRPDWWSIVDPENWTMG